MPCQIVRNVLGRHAPEPFQPRPEPAAIPVRVVDVHGPACLVLFVRGHLYQIHVKCPGHRPVGLGRVGHEHGVGRDPVHKLREDVPGRTRLDACRVGALRLPLPGDKDGNLLRTETRGLGGSAVSLGGPRQILALPLERFKDEHLVGLDQPRQRSWLLGQRRLKKAMAPFEGRRAADAEPSGGFSDAEAVGHELRVLQVLFRHVEVGQRRARQGVEGLFAPGLAAADPVPGVRVAVLDEPQAAAMRTGFDVRHPLTFHDGLDHLPLSCGKNPFDLFYLVCGEGCDCGHHPFQF